MSTRSAETDFEKIYALHFYKVRYFAFHYLGDMEQAEDVAQEVFIKVLESEEKINYNRDVLPYLITIAKNICLNVLKKKGVNQRYSDYSKFSYMDSVNSESLQELPISSLYSAEVGKLFSASLDQMPASVKETFILARIKGHKYKEVAEIQQVSIKTVEWLIAGAMRILQKKFKDYLPFLLSFLPF